MTRYVDIALPLRVDSVFQYALPQGCEDPPLGSIVKVPLGNRTADGFCVGFSSEPAVAKVREIITVRSEIPPAPPSILELARWISRYYHAPLGSVLAAAVPLDARSSGQKRRRHVALLAPRDEVQKHMAALAKSHPSQARVLEVLLSHESGSCGLADLLRFSECSASPVRTLEKKELVRVFRLDEEDGMAFPERLKGPPPPTLNEEQEKALAQVLDMVAMGKHKTFLLHGITGSGKTEIYLRAIEEVVRLGRSAITLVPEIALTPQMVGRYQARFDRVAVWHSGLTGANRRRIWAAVRKGDVDVIVGARSAVFAPFEKLGLLVVDEEHETSFKQQNEPRYHARDVAVLRGRLEGVPVVLGSATPGLESYQNAEAGKYALLSLGKRAVGTPLPGVEIINLAAEKRRGTGGIISERLRILTAKTLDQGEQAIFFLNRRGYSILVQCGTCGFTYTCPRCEIPLTFHKSIDRLICHYCYHGVPPAGRCPDCEQGRLRKTGIGTEQAERALFDLFPQARIQRMDSDAVTTHQDYQKLFERFLRRDIDILIGTQMVAKGFDFPHVTLVGVILADLSLNIPDFRSAERTFQLITQVAGRAGRSSLGGLAVVQTYRPDHYSIELARTHDFISFAEKELQLRKAAGYPPFGHLARLLFTGKDRNAVLARAQEMGKALNAPKVMRILGPAPAPIELIRGRYRFHLVLLSPTIDILHRALSHIRPHLYRGKTVRAALDVDPFDIM